MLFGPWEERGEAEAEMEARAGGGKRWAWVVRSGELWEEMGGRDSREGQV